MTKKKNAKVEDCMECLGKEWGWRWIPGLRLAHKGFHKEGRDWK